MLFRSPAATGPFRAEGEVRLGTDVIAVDRLKAEVDRMTLEGSLNYTWAVGDPRPRVEAKLNAPELDLDRVF